MKQYIYLLKNIGILTIGSFATKLLSFFLVPLYTNVLTTAEYGTFDLFNTTVALLIPILTLNISNAVMRYSLDEDADQTTIFSVGIIYLLKGACILSIFLILNHIFNFVPIVNEYAIYFLLLFVSDALMQIVTMFARGLEKLKDIAISGIVGTFLTITCNILFLILLKKGIDGYFLATLIGILGNGFYLIIRSKMWRFINFNITNTKLKNEMIKYSIPLIANSVSWWVNSASDRYVVVLFCGISANGIYSIASKIPSILNLLHSIFNQAWSLSAVKEFEQKDKTNFFSSIYNLYNLALVILCSLIIVFNRPLARILYAKEFYTAWVYVPFLTISIVFGALSGYIGGIFSAVKDSSVFARTTIIGAVANLVLDTILTYIMGPLGAAIATVFSYWLVWVMRYKHMKKYIDITIKIKRDYIAYLFLVIQAIIQILFQTETILLYIVQVVIFIIITLLFYKEFYTIIHKFKTKILMR